MAFRLTLGTKLLLLLLLVAVIALVAIGQIALSAVDQIATMAGDEGMAAPRAVVRLQEIRGELVQHAATVVILVLACATGVAVLAYRSLVNPLQRLARGTRRMAAGDLGYRIPVETADEIGDLAREFNLMAARLQELNAGLEEKVRQRTRELERKADQLRTINEVARKIASVLSPDELLPHVARLLTTTLGYPAASVLLVEGEELVLRAAAGYGQSEVPTGVRLRLGAEGITGWVARHGKPLLVGDVSREPRYVPFEPLHQTRSELAVPIAIGQVEERIEVLGVLDVESAEPAAFDGDDVATLQILADQVAIALHNARLFAAEHQGRQQTALVLEMTRTVTSTLRLDEVLRKAAEGIARAVGAPAAAVYLLDEAGERLLPCAGTGAPPSPEAGRAFRSTPLDATHPLAREALEGRRSIVVADAAADDRFDHAFAAVLGLKSILVVPLVARDRPLGLAVATDFTRPRDFSAAQIELAGGIGRSAALAIENARLYERSRDLAVMEERTRLAREMHDGLTQSLTGIVMQLETADQVFDTRPDRARERLNKATELARESLQEARRAVWNLRSAPLEQLTLAEAIEREARRLAEDAGWRLDLALEGVPEAVGPELENGLFRIAQEALTNVRKHAQARTVAVELEADEQTIRLCVQDDGVGFDPTDSPRLRSREGFGLIGLGERARLLGGNLQVESAPGKGTCLEVEVPWRRAAVSSAGGPTPTIPVGADARQRGEGGRRT